MNPEGRNFAVDAGAKVLLLVYLMQMGRVTSGSVLFPYRDLIRELARKGFAYYDKGNAPGFETYSEAEEISAINEYIATFEKFVKGKNK